MRLNWSIARRQLLGATYIAAAAVIVQAAVTVAPITYAIVSRNTRSAPRDTVVITNDWAWSISKVDEPFCTTAFVRWGQAVPKELDVQSYEIAFAKLHPSIRERLVVGDPRPIAIVLWGFPFRCFVRVESGPLGDVEAMYWTAGIGPLRHVLYPSHIIWTALVANLAITWCAFAALSIGRTILLVRRRTRLGLCAHCGYPASEGAAVCSECGKANSTAT